MIQRKNLMPLEFYKKEAFTGSEKGMCYRIAKVDDQFEVHYWKAPLCFSKMAEEEMTKATFPFSEEGIEQAAAWLLKAYEDDLDRWKHVPVC